MGACGDPLGCLRVLPELTLDFSILNLLQGPHTARD